MAPERSRSHASVTLTPTEQRLLDVLRSQPDRTFTRAELVARVMPETIVLERTVDVHIKALRKKLGGRGVRIQTVRGQGYRFIANEIAEAGVQENAARKPSI